MFRRFTKYVDTVERTGGDEDTALVYFRTLSDDSLNDVGDCRP